MVDADVASSDPGTQINCVDSGLSFYWMLDEIGLINCNWR